jgi:hypothetical protein
MGLYWCFGGWNLINGFGSIVSVVAAWLFLYIVYIQLIEGEYAGRYPKPHTFASLPLQSVLGN